MEVGMERAVVRPYPYSRERKPAAVQGMRLVIGNVPFADVKLEYGGQKFSLHDFFFAKAVDALRPGARRTQRARFRRPARRRPAARPGR